MHTTFTPSHRGGSGPPMICLHGFTDTWRSWELVMPALERRHDVLAPTLAGHAGGPAIEGEVDADALADAVEETMDEAGFATAHIVGNSLGGAASCTAASPLIEHALSEGWSLDAASIDCPVRLIWGTEDRLLPLPGAAVRYRESWLPQAEWIELEGVGHCPQLDVPVEAAELILGLTGG